VLEELEFVAAAMKGFFVLATLWVFVWWFWRSHRVDSFRRRLFALRHELFAYAADGGVSFDSAGYKELRQRINSLIRFAHQVTLARMGLLGVFGLFWKHREILAHAAEFQKTLDRVSSAEAKKKLNDIHERVMIFMGWHVLSGSPTLWILLFMSIVGFLMSQPGLWFVRKLVELPRIRRGLNLLEASALQS
jgi:hypothetical protein